MNNKLFSILLAIVMITSACVIPIASDEEVDAAGKDSGIVLNEPYGIYLDINDETINQLVLKFTKTEQNSNDKRFIESLIFDQIIGNVTSIMGGAIDIHRIDNSTPLYDIDIDAGFSITNTSKTSSGYVYKIMAIAKGHAGTNAAITNEATNFIGTADANADLSEFVNKNKGKAADKTVDEIMILKANIDLGLDMVVETDLYGNITKIQGSFGRELSYSGEKETLEEVGEYTYLRKAKLEHDSSSYFDIKTETTGSEPKLNITWFLAGDILALDKIIGSYGNTIIALDDIDYTLSYENLDALVKEARKHVTNNENVGMADLLNIIDATPIGPMIKNIAYNVMEEKGDGPMIQIISGFSLGDFYDILYTNNGNVPLIGNLYELIGMEEIKDAIAAIKGFFNFDSIPGFIFGKDGIVLTEDEAKSISKNAHNLANKSINGLKNREFTVEFYEDENASTPVTRVDVKFGKAVVKDELIKPLEEKSNKHFVGWYTFDEDGAIAPVSLGWVCADLKVIPVYAEEVSGLQDIYDATSGDFFAEVTDAVVDISKLAGKNTFLTVKDSGAVKSITWNFPGMESSVDEVNIKFSSKISGKNLEVDFEHSGDLPEGTVVTIDVGAKFGKGDVLNVYHVDSNKKDLVTGMAIVDENGMVKIGLDHCSTYLFEINDTLTHFEEDDSDDDDDKGINLVLFGGIGLAVIVVGLGVFIYIRKH
ncbi:MAG: hypothetical protein J6R75_05735 [Candidatus Methanomethylophilaceae archaeon]|nr:hypothetical protein [Candidatus Methanomethylophilaceae archaeon]